MEGENVIIHNNIGAVVGASVAKVHGSLLGGKKCEKGGVRLSVDSCILLFCMV